MSILNRISERVEALFTSPKEILAPSLSRRKNTLEALVAKYDEFSVILGSYYEQLNNPESGIQDNHEKPLTPLALSTALVRESAAGLLESLPGGITSIAIDPTWIVDRKGFNGSKEQRVIATTGYVVEHIKDLSGLTGNMDISDN